MPKTPIRATALTLLLVLAPACGGDTGSKSADYRPLLHTLTESVILKEHADFATRADDLVTAMTAFEATPDADTLDGAETAWRSTRAAFRKLDAIYFGPIADLGITERIDLAPASPNDIDALVSASTAIDAGAIGNLGGHDKGFLGIEYLIFSSDGAAAALAPLQGDGAAARRRTLARAMAEEIAASAHQLADAWAPDKGGYANDVENAGVSSDRYPSQRAALDDIVGGVGYGFEVVVGIRLAKPLGLKAGGTPDPSQDPTAASDSAAADMQASLAGIHALYDGEGLSERVRSKSTVLDARIKTELDDCSAKITAIPTPFASAVTNDTAAVQAAYEACKTAKATWNTDATSALGATLKPSDNDGD